MELNRENIIKALVYCAEYAPLRCDECPMEAPPMTFKGSLSCSDELMRNARSLIKELTEENAYLKTQLTATEARAESYREENERLRAENEMLLNIKNLNLDKVIADTVRSMRSRIKSRCIEGGIYPAFVENAIDQITKEMLEENA